MTIREALFREKVIEILERAFDVTRTENEVSQNCCFCNTPSVRWIGIFGKKIGLDCNCPETLFVLLTVYDGDKMKRIAKDRNIIIEVIQRSYDNPTP
jgi:hypothetical protein